MDALSHSEEFATFCPLTLTLSPNKVLREVESNLGERGLAALLNHQVQVKVDYLVARSEAQRMGVVNKLVAGAFRLGMPP